MHRKSTRLFRLYPSLYRSVGLSLLLLAALAAPRSHAQSAEQILQQLTELQQQLADTSDPCPLLPKFKSLMNQLANLSPEMYSAMKPVLDSFNSQDDGCSQSASGSSSGSSPASSSQPSEPSSADSGSAAAAAQAAQARAAQQGSGYTGRVAGSFCPASGWYMVQHGDTAVGVQCTPGQLMKYSDGDNQPVPPTHGAGSPSRQTASTQSSSAICPASGWIMIQNGDVAVGQQCTPGQHVSGGSSGGSSSGSSPGGSQGSSPGRSGGTGSSSGSGSASGGGQYVPSLPISCLTMDFNGNYHWDQYYNHCNQDISVTFVFANGVQGTMDPIRAGGTSGTGHSQQEYQNYGGEPSLYICPAGDIPVNAQGTMVNRMGMQYRCKLP